MYTRPRPTNQFDFINYINREPLLILKLSFLNSGHQLSVFNSQAQIQVGGKWNRAKQKVERAFIGVLSGLVFNGLRLLDLAAEQDPRTEVRGDVTLLTGIRDRLHESYQRMQQVNIYNKYIIKKNIYIFSVFYIIYFSDICNILDFILFYLFTDSCIRISWCNGRPCVFWSWFRMQC